VIGACAGNPRAATPSDWQAQTSSIEEPKMLGDWKAQLDVTVISKA